jgi:hypothetical protein
MGRPFTLKWEEATNTQQQNEIKALTASLREQAAQIQKVSAQLEAASPSDGGLEASTLRRKWSTIPKQQYFTISPSRSPRGGFLFRR